MGSSKRVVAPVPEAAMPWDSGALSGGTGRGAEGEGQARAARPNPDEKAPTLIEEVVQRENMFQARKRVLANKGAAGVPLGFGPQAGLVSPVCRVSRSNEIRPH